MADEVSFGEGRARWFVREWKGIGGGFVWANDGAGNPVLDLLTDEIDADQSERGVDLARFAASYPKVFRGVAEIVEAEGLAA